MSEVRLSLLDCVQSGYPAIVCRTSEEWRAIQDCGKIAESLNCKLVLWSETRGFHDLKKTKSKEFAFNEEEYCKILIDGLSKNSGKNVIICLLDFHPYLNRPQVIRTAKDVFQLAKAFNITYIFISDSLEIPADLKHEMFVYDMELPTQSDYEELIENILKTNQINVNLSKEEMSRVCNALMGLTISEAENAVVVSLYKSGTLNLDIIYEIKKKSICQDGLLEYYKSSETIENVGGMVDFKEYAKERGVSTFTEEAREYGLPNPKGVILFGVPGCGKSLAAKALANMWKVPLLKFDLSKLFASLVGETENNTRKALQMAEAMAPCVLWMDEIDKAMSGTQSSGKTDSGVTSRMFGTILTWLQDRTSPVYVIATANNINLPPELLRKGRFDEIFFVDLPTLEERKEIFQISIKKHKRNFEDFNVEILAERADGFNGAEIEESIVSAMFKAWNDGKRPYNTEDIEEAIKNTTPASKGITSETIASLRKWSKEHGIRNANRTEEVKVKEDSTEVVTRKIRR